MGILSELFCDVLCNTIVHNHVHTDMSSSYRWTVLGLVLCRLLCFNQDHFICVRVSCCILCVSSVIVWLSVPVQSIAWKGLSLKWPIICQMGCETYTLTRPVYWCDVDWLRPVRVIKHPADSSVLAPNLATGTQVVGFCTVTNGLTLVVVRSMTYHIFM